MINATFRDLKNKLDLQFFFVVVLFLVSGLSSLIYQVIWTRSLVFVFGSTQFATSTVLSVFMAGLALGSFVAGKQSDKSNINPFLLYGILEGLIAFWALLTPLLFNVSVPIYQMNFQSFHMNPILFGILRYLVAAVILLPPTTCMGATLPLLSKYVTKTIETAGDKVGTLYAINTLGAVLGSMMAGFLFIPNCGLGATTIIAAAMNFLICAGVFLVSRNSQKEQNSGSMDNEERSNTNVTESKPSAGNDVRLLLWCFFVSGGLSMFYEVGWTRILLMVIGSTTYAFTIMLSTFLIGIFAGSFYCAKKVDKLASPITWFAIAQAYLCFAGLFSLLIFNYLPYANLVLGMIVKKNEFLSMLLRFLASAVVLLPITLSLGALFPLAVKVCARDINKLGSSVGKLYSMNTCGAIIGAFVAGFFAIPLLGSEQSLIVASILNLFIGALLLLKFGSVKKSISIFVLVSSLAIGSWGLGRPQILDRNLIAYAQHERRKLVLEREIPSWEKWSDAMKKTTVFYEDGLCATVAVSKEMHSTSLFTNGHCDASDAGDMENQAMLSLLPLCLKPDSKQVCVVGWGSGVSVGYALRFPVLKAICAEIEEVVYKTSEFFHHVNFSPENDTRCALEPSDGRNYLLCTDQKFDVIVSEPSNPWQIGVCNLFTKEYFGYCRNRLNDQGLFVMWCQRNEVSPKNLSQIFSALHAVFPTVYLFDSGLGDTCAIASKEPFRIKVSELKKVFNSKELAPYLKKFKMQTPYDFVARCMACPEGIDIATKNVLANSDDRNYLEFDVAKSYESKQYQQEDDDWVFANSGPIYEFVDYGSDSKQEKADFMAEVGVACFGRDVRRGTYWLEHSIQVHPNEKAYAALIEADLLQDRSAHADQLLLQAKNLFPDDARFLNLEAVKLAGIGKYEEARALLKKAIAKEPMKGLYKLRLAETYSRVYLGKGRIPHSVPVGADPQLVLDWCKNFLTDEQFLSEHQGAYLVIGDAYIQLEKNDEAIAFLKRALKLRPSESRIWALLGRAYAGKNDWDKSEYCMAESRRLGINLARGYAIQVQRYMDERRYEDALGCIQSWLEIYPADSVALVVLKRLSLLYPKANDLLKNQEGIRNLDTITKLSH